MPSERRVLKYGVYLSNCSKQAFDYGVCVAKKSENITKSLCEKEFEQLLNCVRKQNIDMKATCVSHLIQTSTESFKEMKRTRYRRAHRILSLYRNNFGFRAPFRVLLDGTFAQAALKNQINLREQLPKYLNEEVVMCVTQCVLSELEKLGSCVYGALPICKQFDIDKCNHSPVRAASECLFNMGVRNKNHTKYFIATQDMALTQRLRELVGVPILYIKYKGILIDDVSEKTLKRLEFRPDIQNMRNELANTSAANQPESLKKARKRPKGPNPLSVKKKRKIADCVAKNSTDTRTASGKRRRRKKPLEGSSS